MSEYFCRDFELAQLRVWRPNWQFWRYGDLLIAWDGQTAFDSDCVGTIRSLVYNHPFNQAAEEYSQRRHAGGGPWPPAR